MHSRGGGKLSRVLEWGWRTNSGPLRLTGGDHGGAPVCACVFFTIQYSITYTRQTEVVCMYYSVLYCPVWVWVLCVLISRPSRYDDTSVFFSLSLSLLVSVCLSFILFFIIIIFYRGPDEQFPLVKTYPVSNSTSNMGVQVITCLPAYLFSLFLSLSIFSFSKISCIKKKQS